MKSSAATLVFAVWFAVLVPRSMAQVWQEITPATGPAPSPRTLSAAVYDPLSHAMIVFGGEDASTRQGDVWAFDLATNTWTDITPGSGAAPAGRITPAAVYDPDHHQMVTFSGQGVANAFFNDTWKFDLAALTWAQFSPSSPIPTTRYGVATCYDVAGKTQVTFAGFTFQGRFDDTWRFDPAGDAWTNVSPPSGSPLERCLHVGCYDALDRVMIIYGGQNGGPLGDIWAFDLLTETWTDLTPATGPAPRWFSTLEYDVLKNRATMFSGNRSAMGRANDVWVFDLWVNEWFELSPSGTPPAARDGAASIYVAAEDRMVIFGGQTSSTRLSDVWSLNNLSSTPTAISPQHPAPSPAVLRQNFPNPFNPSTTISFELSIPSTVVLTVYDMVGRKVRVLSAGPRAAGQHAVGWDGMNDSGVRVSSGVYLYRLRAGDFVQTKKMTLLK
ncbi:MAG: T9SS type A sorting domain-containing protein [Candidatus Krumholzibacteriota bacterium]|nr:T9SS type A sorting domain-containing protein [Candidatus Krumholzibacteriota bacterium]